MILLLSLPIVLLLLSIIPAAVGTGGGPGTGYDIDIAWNFDTDNNFEGWGNATSYEMQLDARVENGELRGSIEGFSPNIDSPQLFIDITRRHYIAIRMLYMGASNTGALLLRSGAQPSGRQNADHSRNYWYNNLQMTVVSSSPSFGVHKSDRIADGNPYTYYQSASRSAIFLLFDVGSFKYVTSITILSLGDTTSPKNCILQQSKSSGAGGPYETVSTFTLAQVTSDLITDTSVYESTTASNGFNRQINNQTISYFSGYARYWRLLVLNNYGGNRIAIREVSLNGYAEQISEQAFAIDNTGRYKTYYLPIYPNIRGPLLRMRLEIQSHLLDFSSMQTANQARSFREALSIDFIRIAKAPEVWRVTGCLDKYYDNSNLLNPQYSVETVEILINDRLPLRSYSKLSLPLLYATTYDCPVNGGVDITVEGINFGPTARVFIGGKECVVTYYGINPTLMASMEKIICTLPAGSSGTAILRVENGILPGLFQETSTFSYRSAPPIPAKPVVTNIAARRVDLVWSPPTEDPFIHMSVTGYKILWFQPQYSSMINNVTVGNITTTSIRGLEPNTEYVFAVAAMSEGAYPVSSAGLPTDMYGRRSPTGDALISSFSTYTNISATTAFDLNFDFFNANKTINASGSSSSNSNGPTGMYGSEGHYGLVVVGSANIQNCNVSSTCCDGFNATIGLSSCGTNPTVCAVYPSRMLNFEYVIDGITRRQVPSNLPYENGGLPEIVILTLEQLIADKGADLPSIACGPSLRLTPSEARQSGSAWYRRKVNVREGFDTTIKFEISNPSQRCDRLDDVNTFCRSRGADGFAFVIQNVGFTALGNAGSGIGYEGIDNALAVELDTYHNYDNMDFYENHISVMTQGWRYNISANHSRSLATTNRCPDLTDGQHSIRIRYDPNFDINSASHPSFQVNGYTTYFLENGDFQYGGEGDWGTGFGLLYIYIDDMYSPVITTPLNLDATLNLDEGRAIVGLTSATGDNTWQAHDVLSWEFTSLYIDQKYEQPIIINDIGDYKCVNTSACVHRTDYDHYMRSNSIWEGVALVT